MKNTSVFHFFIVSLVVAVITISYQYKFSSHIKGNSIEDMTHKLNAIHPLLRERLFVSSGNTVINGSNITDSNTLGNFSVLYNKTIMHIPKQLSRTLYVPGDRLPTYEEYRVSNDLLPRRLDLQLEKRLFDLVLEISLLLKSHGISFTMAHGMLLGSYLFHSMIPWDDDLDLYIDIKDINNLKAMFRTEKFKKKYGVHSYWEKDMYSEAKLKEEVPWSNTYSCGSGVKTSVKCYQQGKIYFKKAARAGGQAWTYPFVDFTFYKNNGTHIFNHDNWKHEPKVILPVEEFYPLTLRPFDSYWLPSPKNTATVLKMKFKQFHCKGHAWDHVHETGYKARLKARDCEKLKSSYPYVKRRKYHYPNGTEVVDKVIEDVMLADVVLHSVVVDVAFTKEDILEI